LPESHALSSEPTRQARATFDRAKDGSAPCRFELKAAVTKFPRVNPFALRDRSTLISSQFPIENRT